MSAIPNHFSNEVNNRFPIPYNTNLNTKTSTLNKVTQAIKSLPTNGETFNTRIVKRVSLSVTLFLRKPLDPGYLLQPVSTMNISRYGALIISNTPLEIGTELEVTRQKVEFLNEDQSKAITTFLAKAIVRNIRKDPQSDKYLIGIEFESTVGKWIIH